MKTALLLITSIYMTFVFMIDLYFDLDYLTWVWGITALIAWMGFFTSIIVDKIDKLNKP